MFQFCTGGVERAVGAEEDRAARFVWEGVRLTAGLAGEVRKGDVRLPGKRGFKLPWREADPPNHQDDKVDSDQKVVNKELSLCRRC